MKEKDGAPINENLERRREVETRPRGTLKQGEKKKFRVFGEQVQIKGVPRKNRKVCKKKGRGSLCH